MNAGASGSVRVRPSQLASPRSAQAIYCDNGSTTPALISGKLSATGDTTCSVSVYKIFVVEQIKTQGVEQASNTALASNTRTALKTITTQCIGIKYSSRAEGAYKETLTGPSAVTPGANSSGSSSPDCPNIGPINPQHILWPHVNP